MEYAPDDLQSPLCLDCRHYEDAPELVESLCHKGVHYGRALVGAVSAKTMRDDHWWGRESCGKEGRHWEEKT